MKGLSDGSLIKEGYIMDNEIPFFRAFHTILILFFVLWRNTSVDIRDIFNFFLIIFIFGNNITKSTPSPGRGNVL